MSISISSGMADDSFWIKTRLKHLTGAYFLLSSLFVVPATVFALLKVDYLDYLPGTSNAYEESNDASISEAI